MSHTDIPPRWRADPSRWSRRLPLLGLAAAGFGIAMYLSLYQFGAYGTVWDPLFGDGSAKVLHSVISKPTQPLPDAFLGALGYLAELIAGSIGGAGRWRRMPWAVCLYELIVFGLALVSVALVISQPLLAHDWCTLCLLSAAISVVLVPLTLDEGLATVALLRRERHRGRSLWQALSQPAALSDVPA